jgi:hypothetical protein
MVHKNLMSSSIPYMHTMKRDAIGVCTIIKVAAAIARITSPTPLLPIPHGGATSDSWSDMCPNRKATPLLKFKNCAP